MAQGSLDEDALLMVRVSQDDREAFALLVEGYRGRALNFAYCFLGDRHAAEDMVQEAFVRVYQSRHRYRPTASFSTWFLRILSRLCLNEIRRRRRHPQALGPEPESPSPSAEDHYEQRELGAAVARALADLPDRQRLAVILQRFEGLTYAEIGRILGLSPGAVDGLLSRAKESLRRNLSPYFDS